MPMIILVYVVRRL